MKSSFSSCPQHETFEELAALAAAGELSAPELERLGRHLGECPSCREAYDGFAEVTMNSLGLAAASDDGDGTDGFRDSEDFVAHEHLARLKRRIALEHSTVPEPVGIRPAQAPRETPAQPWTHREVIYGIAATVLLTTTLAGAVVFWRAAKQASAERARSHELQVMVDSLRQEKTNEETASDRVVMRSLEESQNARGSLEKSLALVQAKNKELLDQQMDGDERLKSAIASIEQLKQQLAINQSDRDRLAKLEQDSERKLHAALAELDDTRQRNLQLAERNEAQEDATLEPNAQNRAAAVSTSEAEARNLFGARDLHIVDVYDVAGDGQTKRTYGRVYYVEKKLLVFYAFDLDNHQDHKLGSFQAWGYREANVGKPLSLGLFTIDDSPAGRWVLTENRPDVLSHIDAVFVTVEPPGGSKSPRGKKVLYANLVGPPNHP
jgi:anti-sigma factor ChrR (cupin superfamily)